MSDINTDDYAFGTDGIMAKKKAAKKSAKPAGKKAAAKKAPEKKGPDLKAPVAILSLLPVAFIALITAIPAILPAAGYAWDGFSAPSLWMSMITGAITGATGNPLMVDVIPGVLSMFPSLKETAALFPAEVLSEKLPGGLHIVMVSLFLGGSTLIPAAKKNMMKYEPVLLVPSLGLLGMVFAFRARSMAPMFNDLFSGIMDSMYFTGLIALLLLILVMMRWINGTRPRFAHWGWCVAAAPIVGFWVGYVGEWWPYFLIVLLLFIYCFMIDESLIGIACGLPLMYAPLAGAKLLMSNYEGWENIVTSSELWSGPAITTLAFMTAAHVCVIFIMKLLPAKISTGIFSALTVLFLLFAMYRLF